MVCPVTNPMYYGVGSQKLEGIPTSRQVYLPAGKWYDFYTNEEYQGGQYITADAPLDKIPLFVKAGAIIPRAETALSTAEQNGDLIIHVYSGADGEFTYYNDSGDGYGYEKGDYEVHNLRYSDNEKKLLPCDLLDRKNVTVRYI
jgi:alpha-D-xyloside xylohydrolase